ncbi:MAG TPA: hypothetical protein VFF03_09000 [Rhodocyclaceae bacterium]|nr:hypothetical protein [Rhodocyclaceae bacterium]
MDMENIRTGETQVEDECLAQKKKRWNAPRLTSVSIASMTEGMFNPGTDGAGSSTMS